jgi:hypothetical protein
VLSGTADRFSCIETIVGAPRSGGDSRENLTGTYLNHRASGTDK